MRAFKLFVLCGAFLILPLAGFAAAAGAPGQGTDDTGGSYTPTSAAAASGATNLPVTGSSSTLPMFWIGSVAVALGGTALFAARRNSAVRRRVSA